MVSAATNRYKLILFLLSSGLFILLPLKNAPIFGGLPLKHYLNIFSILFFVLIFFILEWKNIDKKTFQKIACILIILSLVKISANLIMLPHGLAGYYYNNKDFSGNFKKSTEYLGIDATRIDKNISFSTVGYCLNKNPFNLWFLNDNSSENYDFSILWKGFIYIPGDSTIKISIIAKGTAELFINNKSCPGKEALLNKGFHGIEIKYTGTKIAEDSLELKWDLNGKIETIPPRYLYTRKPSKIRFAMDGFTRYLLLINLILKLSALFYIRITCIKNKKPKEIFSNEKILLFIFFASYITIAFFKLLKSASSPLFNILSRRDDWLTFESHARMILLGDWLDKTEAPFYFVPFYRYFLAFVHYVFGENLFMAYWIQNFLIAGSAIFVYKIAKRLFNTNTAVLSLLLFSFNATACTTAKNLLSEPLATFFSCASIYCLIKALDTKKAVHLCLSGLLLGFAIITRPNILTYLLFIIPWLYLFLKRVPGKKALKYTLLFSASVIIIITAVTIRNYATSGKACLLTSAVEKNFWEGNQPPKSVNFTGMDKNKLYNALRLDYQIREVFEYARQKPLLFTQGLIAKLSYVAGWDMHNFSHSAKKKLHLDKLLTLIIFIAGYFWAAGRKGYKLRKELLIPASFAAITIITLVIVKPMNYGWRLQLVAIPFMLIFAAFVIDSVQLKNASSRGRAFYTNFLISAIFLYLLTANTLFPFAVGFYSLFYFLGNKKLYSTA